MPGTMRIPIDIDFLVPNGGQQRCDIAPRPLRTMLSTSKDSAVAISARLNFALGALRRRALHPSIASSESHGIASASRRGP